MKVCSKCGKPIADEATFCGNCGAKIDKNVNKKRIIIIIISVVVVLLFAGLAVILGKKFKKEHSSGTEKLDITTVSSVVETETVKTPIEYHDVQLKVYDAMSAATDEDGDVSIGLVNDVNISVREGINNKDGQVVDNINVKMADEDELINVSLPVGDYSLQIDSPGYVTAFYNVSAETDDTISTIYMVHAINEDEIAVVLAWDGDSDLDLTVFTHEEATDGYNSFIGGEYNKDYDGNRLIHDNKKICEVISLKTTDTGTFKIYVNDYTHSKTLSDENNIMAGGCASVYIYNSKGLIDIYSYPAGSTGLVWEVAEVSGNGESSKPCQITYTDISDQSWWYEDKGFEANDAKLKQLLDYSLEKQEESDSECTRLYGLLCNLWVYQNETGNNADLILTAEEDALADFFGVAGLRYDGDVIYYDSAPGVFCEHSEMYSDNYLLAYTSVSDLEYIAYSITGKSVNLRNASGVNVVDYKGQSCFETRFELADGDYWYLGSCPDSVSNVEYVGRNTWKVTMPIYDVPYDHSILSNYKRAEAIFYLVPNASSVYGFNVVGLDSERLDTGWVTLYEDYIGEADILDTYRPSEVEYELIYLNNDEIPELVLHLYGDYYIFSIDEYNRVYPCLWFDISGTYSQWVEKLQYVPFEDKIFIESWGGNIYEYERQEVCFNVVDRTSYSYTIYPYDDSLETLYYDWTEYDTDLLEIYGAYVDEAAVASGTVTNEVPGYSPDDNWVDVTCRWSFWNFFS